MKIFPIESLVPHAKPMLLLDSMTDMDGESFESEVVIRADSEFCDGAQIGAWVGIEYMAQTVAAYSGHQKRIQGQEPRVGLLLGALRYEISLKVFPAGGTIEIEAKLHFLDESGLSAFRCEIRHQGRPVACAMLKTFEPL